MDEEEEDEGAGSAEAESVGRWIFDAGMTMVEEADEAAGCDLLGGVVDEGNDATGTGLLEELEDDDELTLGVAAFSTAMTR